MWQVKMEYKYLRKVVELHTKFIQPLKGQPRGCWNIEINSLEKQIGFELPIAYKEYLKFMGRDYDGILCGSNCFITDAIENTKYLPELLAENEIDFILPQHYLAFYSHQGYILAWFELPKINEDPPVWLFIESENKELPVIIG